jgi:hypothetical protein
MIVEDGDRRNLCVIGRVKSYLHGPVKLWLLSDGSTERGRLLLIFCPVIVVLGFQISNFLSVFPVEEVLKSVGSVQLVP